MSVEKQLSRARSVGVPIVAISTPDPAATVMAACRVVSDQTHIAGFVAQWDCIRGLRGVGLAAQDACDALVENGFDDTINNPVAAVAKSLKLRAGSVVCVHLADRWLRGDGAAAFIQAVMNVRDAFKTNHKCLILLGSAIVLPPELQADVLVIDEPLPSDEQLEAIITALHSAADLPLVSTSVESAIQATRGLPAFAAEQVTALSLSRNKGLDIESLWGRKIQQIEQTPGLKVYRGHDSFDRIGGVPVIKDFLRRLIAGRSRPNVVVFIDEIEKMLGGSSGGDTSGTSKDQLGSLLSYMQDHSASGLIFIGPPGAAKSAVAKATGAEAGVLTVQLDLGAAKSRWVGESESQIRSALKVITAVGGDQSLWIATCNSITELPPELRRRFTLGTWFFDLPDAAERAAIWDIYVPNELVSDSIPADDGWTGAEIRQCCDLSNRLGCTLHEASQFVVPVSRSASEAIDRLRTLASGRFNSASTPGVYVKRTAEPTPVARRLSVECE